MEFINQWLRNVPFRSLYLFASAFLISFLATPIVRLIAVKLKIMDYPDKRKIHKKPTPLLGGIPIYIAFAVTVICNFSFSLQMKGVAIAATLILVMGLIDDYKGLSATFRILGQIAAVAILVKYKVVLSFLPNTWWGYTGEIILTAIWIIGVTNAINFLDGIDGLTSGLGAIACFSFFIIANETHQPYLGFLTIILAGGCLGFLKYNFPPATIFLGDSGSTFIGFSLASLGVMGHWSEGNPIVSLSVPILVLAVPIFDMIYTTVSRFHRGVVKTIKEWLEYTGKDHLHHRHLHLGLTETQTVLFIYLICICLGISAITIRHATTLNALLEILQAAIIFVIITILMIAGRRRHIKRITSSAEEEEG